MLQLTAAMELVAQQLRELEASSLMATSIKHVLVRVRGCFTHSIDLCRKLPLPSTEPAPFLDFLSALMQRVRALTPGNSVVLPGGFKDGRVLFVVHCDSTDLFTVAVVSTGDGLAYHP